MGLPGSSSLPPLNANSLRPCVLNLRLAHQALGVRHIRGDHRTLAGDPAEEQDEVPLAVAVQVVVEHPAVGLARAAFVEDADAGAVVTEEGALPVDAGREAVLDFVGRGRGDLFVRVERVDVAPLRTGRGAGQRADLLGVGEGIDDLRVFNSQDFIRALFNRDA